MYATKNVIYPEDRANKIWSDLIKQYEGHQEDRF